MAKTFVSTNQITQAEVNDCASLACDGIHFIGENSPTVTDWAPLRKISLKPVITEEGGNDRHWLLNPNWHPPETPRADFNIKIAEAAGFAVEASLEYVENPCTMLTPADYHIAVAEYTHKPVMLLARSFTDYQNTKYDVRQAIKSPEVRGITFELNPSAKNVKDTNIVAGIKEILKAGKYCSVLLPPLVNTKRYEYDIKAAVTELQKSPDFKNPRLSIILACYRREETSVNFLGKHNSIFAALRWIKNNT